MCSDIRFFHADGENMGVSIVEPHGHQLADALPKLWVLADFSATHGEFFQRIEVVVRMKDGTLRVRDLTDAYTRENFTGGEDIETLYLSGGADDY